MIVYYKTWKLFWIIPEYYGIVSAFLQVSVKWVYSDHNISCINESNYKNILGHFINFSGFSEFSGSIQ